MLNSENLTENYRKISRKIFEKTFKNYLTNNLYYDIMLLQQKETTTKTTKGEINMFMNEKELIEYLINKFKDNLFIVYITFLTITAFMALFVLCC